MFAGRLDAQEPNNARRMGIMGVNYQKIACGRMIVVTRIIIVSREHRKHR
jgi:hypothetical protein